jgi:hypothetical protein
MSKNPINTFACFTKEGKKQIAEALKKDDKSKYKKKIVFDNNTTTTTKNIVAENTQSTKVINKPDILNLNLNLNDIKSSLFGKSDKKENVTSVETHDITEKENDNEQPQNHYLNSQWTVWVHRNACENWDVSSYQNIFTIDSIETFWDFFNAFHKINKEENQYFIMKNKIKPIWEDNNNRDGGICSLKMDCYDRNSKNDVGSEIIICLCMLIMNESYIQDNNEINGISYSVKNKSIYIKIWTKDFNNDISDKLPKNLMIKFNNVMRINMFRKYENYISVRYTPIKPEYDDSNNA